METTMNIMQKSQQSATAGLETYIIQHGKEDARRLNVLAAALAPSTTAFLDRLGSLEGLTVVDAGCGGGDVTVELARRVGPTGRVIGLDADAGKLEAATEQASTAGLLNCTFMKADLMDRWPVNNVSLVYARFVLTHLPAPERFVASARDALVPGGKMAVEDVDTDGCFSYPKSAAFAKGVELYVRAAQLRKCDPNIGQRLDRLLEECGFSNVATTLAHPFGRQGPAKEVMVMTLEAISGAVRAAGLVGEAELRSLITDASDFAARPDTTVGMPRVFQAWGMKA
jgi:ubiquinone/menaquinone biosynthesis C-methylase UbiE